MLVHKNRNCFDIPSVWVDFDSNGWSANHQSIPYVDVHLESQLYRLSLHCHPYGPVGSSSGVQYSSILCFLISRIIFRNELPLKIRTFRTQTDFHVDLSCISLGSLCSWHLHLELQVIEMCSANI